MARALEVIQPHKTWNILDSSKLTTYMECPRKYFFRYLLGWSSASPNNHLVFGSSWHLAQEHLLLTDFAPQEVPEAQLKFLRYYRDHFPQSTDELFEPKTPQNAFISIQEYARKYRYESAQFTILYVELGGLVLVSETRTMAFKCDAIRQDNFSGAIQGLDHKTSQRRYSDWGDHWTLSTQMLTYLHALHCLYGSSDELEMLVRCSFFYKRQPTDFAEHPIRKSHEQMQAWLERTNQWIDHLEIDKLILKDEDTTDELVMQSFAQNDTACFNFGRRCEFFDYCNAWANPLTRCDEPPLGLNVEWWDPLDRPEIHTKINLATQSGQPVEMESESEAE